MWLSSGKISIAAFFFFYLQYNPVFFTFYLLLHFFIQALDFIIMCCCFPLMQHPDVMIQQQGDNIDKWSHRKYIFHVHSLGLTMLQSFNKVSIFQKNYGKYITKKFAHRPFESTFHLPLFLVGIHDLGCHSAQKVLKSWQKVWFIPAELGPQIAHLSRTSLQNI